MNPGFYLWISTLISNYEAIISPALLKMGYTVAAAGKNRNGESVICQDKLISYRLTHPSKQIGDLEQDLTLILLDNKIKYHSCVIVYNCNGRMDSMWWGSNIDTLLPKKKRPTAVPTKSQEEKDKEIDDVITDMNKMLNSYGDEKLNDEEKRRFKEKRKDT